MIRSGGCACGAIRYRVTEDPFIVHVCHCRDCQRHTGSAFVINLWIERRFVETEPAPTQYFRLTAGTGKPHDIYYCEHCGTRLWSRYHASFAGTILLRAGTLDEPASVTPEVHIFTRDKLPWVALPEGVPAFAGMYRLNDVWSAAMKERLKRNSALEA